MGRVQGRIALVTGAAQGLGLAIAGRLAEEGAILIVTDIKAPEIESVATRLGATAMVQDVASEPGWIALMAEVEARFGGLHILVNNAGIEGDPDAAKDPEHAPVEDWNRIFAVNGTGVFLACKHGIGLMAKSGGGSIVNLSSVASLVPTPFLTAYGATKAAVEHLTRSVALHCAQAGHRIRCNSVHPGQVRTPMLAELFERMGAQMGLSAQAFSDEFVKGIPMGDYQDPVDIGNLVLFLASEEARYITGQAIACDGGFTLAH